MSATWSVPTKTHGPVSRMDVFLEDLSRIFGHSNYRRLAWRKPWLWILYAWVKSGRKARMNRRLAGIGALPIEKIVYAIDRLIRDMSHPQRFMVRTRRWSDAWEFIPESTGAK
jgi:hypothetical protein